MNVALTDVVKPLVRRKIFATEEDAIRTTMSEYILRHISALHQEISQFENKYGMRFRQFGDYLHERSVLLTKGNISPEQRQTLGQAIMLEEDDWLEWKASKEILESWIGLREEAAL
ncbi:MAG: hypothetical protein KJ638_04280 [Chloroflexi bacterium]|nr:hypothetical protein [Chloroflexota bacterium]